MRTEIRGVYTAVPCAPALIHPANHAGLSGLPDSLVWHDIFSVTDGYNLEVFSDSNLTLTVINDTVRSTTSTDRPDPTVRIDLPDGVCWWCMTGLINIGRGPASEVRTFGNVTVDVVPCQEELLRVYVLHINYSNPFNANTTIKFEVPRTLHVTLTCRFQTPSSGIYSH